MTKEIILLGNTVVQEHDWCDPKFLYVSNGREVYKIQIEESDEHGESM